MKKYEYLDELKKFNHFTPPCNPFIYKVGNMFLSIFYYLTRSNKEFNVYKKSLKINDNSGNKKSKIIKYFLIENKKDKNKKLPLIIFFHGGGFVYKGSLHHYKLLKNLVKKTGYRGVYLDYRLAKKYRYPSQYKDIYNLYLELINKSEEYKIDLDNISVVGDSAGGTLATALIYKARENNLVIPKKLLLLYPYLSDDFNSDSMKKYDDTAMCNTKMAIKFIEAWVDKDSIKKEDNLHSLINLKDLSYFPATFIEIAEYDSLKDGATLFYERLKKESNNKVFLKEIKKAMHGYDIAYDAKFMEEINEERVNFLTH